MTQSTMAARSLSVFAATALRIRSFVTGFTSGFWIFFAVAFFFDLGFGLFFFLFNLYLTDLGFNERVVGQVTALMTLGNVAGSIPGVFLARRYGVRPLLLFTFIAAPLICMLRLIVLAESAQRELAFATGIALCCWPICFSPTVAKVTDEHNRATAFGIVFATGIGMGTFSGIAGGYLPQFLHGASPHDSVVASIRIVLLAACGVTMLGIWPIAKLRLEGASPPPIRRAALLHPFLRRFLPAFIIWSVVTGSFPAFAAVYLQQSLRIPLAHLGVVFSVSQIAQFAAVLCAPLLIRRTGTIRAVIAAQLATALFLVLLGLSRSASHAIVYFVLFCGFQFMSGPGIYCLLMDRIPDQERSTASALQNMSGALCQAGTAALTGSCIVRFGYQPVLLANAAVAVVAALLFLKVQHAVCSEP
jgi:MFS family permease